MSFPATPDALADSFRCLVSSALARMRADFPGANPERVRKFALDYLKTRLPRVMETISEEMIWPDLPPISADIMAETCAETHAKLLLREP